MTASLPITSEAGPWRVQPVIGLPDEEWWAVVTEDGTQEICIMPRASGEANAHLISAAPRLYAALERLLKKFASCARMHGNGDEAIADATADFYAVLAKARGQS